MPVPLTVCPVCSAGIKQTRGWTWIDAAHILGAGPCDGHDLDCDTCPLSPAVVQSIGRAGLLWIGEKFYATTAEFTTEAAKLGISRRIAAIPRGFKVRETWVLFAHPKGAWCGDCDGDGVIDTGEGEPENVPSCRTCKGTGRVPGVFRLFRPTAIEKIVTETQSRDLHAMQLLMEQGINIVIVPDDDPDHQGSVHRVKSR